MNDGNFIKSLQRTASRMTFCPEVLSLVNLLPGSGAIACRVELGVIGRANALFAAPGTAGDETGAASQRQESEDLQRGSGREPGPQILLHPF